MLDALSTYAPTKNFEPQIIIGDQLTAAHIGGAFILCSSHLTAETKLEGFVEAESDWHARLSQLWYYACVFL